MDRFQAMQVFTRVVEANSFSKAAQAMRLSPSSVTSVIQNLEESLGVRLLQRTTRQLHVTDDGAVYYERCLHILADLEQAEASVRSATGEPKGRLRVEIAGSIGRQIVLPTLKDFHERFPDVELLIGLGNGNVDLIQDGVDCAIRAGNLQSSRLVARRIGTLKSVVCASPAYLARHGEPTSLDELSRHQAVGIVCERTGRPQEWDFVVEGEMVSVKLNSRLAVNESDGYVMCGLQGLGLIRPLEFLVRPYLKSGRLREVLSHLKAPSVPLFAIYPHSRLVSPAARVFVNWIIELFERSPAFPRQTLAATAAL
jgi:LysR family transcriptional regulator for bpeEF and oprC